MKKAVSEEKIRNFTACIRFIDYFKEYATKKERYDPTYKGLKLESLLRKEFAAESPLRVS